MEKEFVVCQFIEIFSIYIWIYAPNMAHNNISRDNIFSQKNVFY